MIYGAGGLSGLAAWRLLQRTADSQMVRLAQEPSVQRERLVFIERMTASHDADSLIGDFRSMKVALTAFGLEADLGNKAFIKKILTSDLNDEKSLANRLADKRYRSMAQAFGYSTNGQPSEGTAEAIAQRYIEREFERRVGEGNNDLRLALYASRELAVIASSNASDDTKWYSILGSAPLAQVVRVALGLPESMARAPIDQQLSTMREAASRKLGIKDLNALTDPALLDRLLDNFVIRSAASSTTSTPYNTALALLSGMPQPGVFGLH